MLPLCVRVGVEEPHLQRKASSLVGSQSGEVGSLTGIDQLPAHSVLGCGQGERHHCGKDHIAAWNETVKKFKRFQQVFFSIVS